MKSALNVLCLALWSSHAVWAAETVYIQPGQCIVVGGQQVCAHASATAGTVVAQDEVTFNCLFGHHPGATTPDIDTYQLFQVNMKPDGKKFKTPIKNFGNNGKDACEKEADSRDERRSMNK